MNKMLTVTVAALALAACSDSSRPPLNTAPTIAAIADVTLQANTSSGPITVNLSDDTTALEALSVAVSSNNDVLLPTDSLALAAAAAGRSLTIVPAPDTLGQATITVTVSDERGATRDTSFALTVVPQQVTFGSVLRSVFDRDANDTPRELGALDIQPADDGDDFNDLL